MEAEKRDPGNEVAFTPLIKSGLNGFGIEPIAMNEMSRILTVVHFEHVHGTKVGMPLGKPLEKKNSLKKLRAPGRKVSRGP